MCHQFKSESTWLMFVQASIIVSVERIERLFNLQVEIKSYKRNIFLELDFGNDDTNSSRIKFYFDLNFFEETVGIICDIYCESLDHK